MRVGVEPTACLRGTDFVAESIGGAIFENVDLTDGDWAEYDEDNDTSVSITNVVYSIEKF